MILKIIALISIVILLAFAFASYKLQKFREEVTTPVTTVIDEGELSVVLQRFYSAREAEKVINELKQEKMSKLLLKGSVGSVRPDIHLHKREFEWVVIVGDSSSFSFAQAGFVGVGGNGEFVSATLLRNDSPYQMFREKVERHAADLLLVIHDGNILTFDFSAKRFHYRSIDN